MNKTVLMVLTGVIFLGCIASPNQIQAHELKLVRIAAYKGDAAALVYIAKDMGFFEKNGLNVSISDFASGRLAMESMLEGNEDLATSANMVFVTESFNEPDLRVLASVSLFGLNNMVIRVDGEVKDIEDISGKRVGLSKKSSSEFFFHRYLTLKDLGNLNVTYVDMNPQTIKESIINGSYAVVVTWDPYTYEIQKVLGPKVMVIPIQGSQKVNFLLSTKKKWLENNPDDAEKILKSLIEASQWINADTERAKDYFLNRFNYEREYLSYSWDKCTYQVTLKQSLLIAMDEQAEWMIKQGYTNTTDIPNYLELVDEGPLEEIDPKSVTII
ncbi:MAG: ABC transporter substrate-binding protein [Candidatus Altiarchaeota archaeon]|nr:ABC transporter substrate-binding protein [Candidatus Altiarchaeota archaeon]